MTAQCTLTQAYPHAHQLIPFISTAIKQKQNKTKYKKDLTFLKCEPQRAKLYLIQVSRSKRASVCVNKGKSETESKKLMHKREATVNKLLYGQPCIMLNTVYHVRATYVDMLMRLFSVFIR